MPIQPTLPTLYDGLTISKAKLNGGYGSNSAGMLTNKKLDKHHYGVKGQGLLSNQGYIYPVETANNCYDKYIGISVYPIVASGGTFAQGADVLKL